MEDSDQDFSHYTTETLLSFKLKKMFFKNMVSSVLNSETNMRNCYNLLAVYSDVAQGRMNGAPSQTQTHS